MRRFVSIVLFSLVALLGFSACGGSDLGTPASTVKIGPETAILDVRTESEFNSGHLDGAQLLDFNAGAVVAEIPTMNPDAEYYVYCRSGNRSGQAVALMEQAGFINVTDLGSLERAAEATGIPVVK